MDKKDSKVNQILAHLAGAASVAKDGVSDAVQTAGQAVNEKYSAVKLTLEVNRLHDEQIKLFADIGRTMFLVRTGAFDAEVKTEDGTTVDAQQTIDALLEQADQKQTEIDAAAEKLAALNGTKVCAVCGHAADPKDVYCSACGTKFPADA